MYYHIILQKWIVFLHRLFLTSYIYTGGHFKIFLEKGTYECLEMPCENFSLEKNEIKYYWNRVLKNSTSSGDMYEMVYHWLVSFEKSHKKYIGMPSLSLNPLPIEESLFVTVWSPPGFINRENETRCCLNSTFQLLYFNVIFRELVFKINYYTMMNDLKRESQDFLHNFQNIMIMRELQKNVGERYLGGEKIYSYVLHFGKYNNEFSDGCKWIRWVVI